MTYHLTTELKVSLLGDWTANKISKLGVEMLWMGLASDILRRWTGLDTVLKLLGRDTHLCNIIVWR